MKHQKNKRYSNNDLAIMQSIIDGLRANNEELQAEINRLRAEIDETNAMNIWADEDDKNYQNLVHLNTLLLVLMNIALAHCDNSTLGKIVDKAIKKYNIEIAKSLPSDTVFVKDEDLSDWSDEEENEYENEDGEEEF